MNSKFITLPEDFENINTLRQDAHQTASTVRETFWTGRYPVDPVKIALALGAEVYEANLGSDIFGATLQDSETSMRIYINKNRLFAFEGCRCCGRGWACRGRVGVEVFR